jgi:isoquinoline 1-oxidoreductase subunit beta
MKRYAEQSLANPGRRVFLQVAAIAGGGFAIGFGPFLTSAEAAAGTFAPNAFVRIGTDSAVTVVIKHLEMGQGVSTGLPTLVAEELDADWNQIHFEHAPADASRYNNLLWGKAQGTGGSTAIANSYEQLRMAGSAARAMLVAAAAQQWKVPPAEIGISEGVVSHKASGRTASFGELAAAAAKLPVPTDLKLKDPKDFKLIGKRIPRKDSKAKTDGSAVFTIDVKLPGMLTAVVAHPPRFGAKVKSFDAARAKAVKGVVDVVQIPNGVAVLAGDFWTAKQGREALTVEWDVSAATTLGTTEIMAQYKALGQKPGLVARSEGEIEKALAGAAKKVEAEFEFPYLAHAAMEPLNCVAKLGKDGCEIWNGEQMHTGDQYAVAKYTGLKPEQVRINTLYAGGSFGRRANPQADYVVEAVSIAKALQGSKLGDRPVKLMWTREDDMRGGFYRPMNYHRITARLDQNGQVIAWHHRIVGQSIFAGTANEAMVVKNGVDGSSVEGAASLPYDIPTLLVDLHSPKIGVPVLWWRSVGSTHTAFSTEIFIDEMAAAAGRDPVEFRRALLAKHPRHLGVLNLAAEKAGWGEALPKGKGRGIAVHESFNSFVAEVADVTVNADGSFRVERVVCAVDCGVAVNPDVIRAQMEGGIGYGLSAALYNAITLKGGTVEQSNFHDYPSLRIAEMPKIEVHIVPSGEKPTGVGEPGTPVIAPAVANAIYAATGKRLRSLPLKINA